MSKAVRVVTFIALLALVACAHSPVPSDYPPPARPAYPPWQRNPAPTPSGVFWRDGGWMVSRISAQDAPA